MGDFFCPEGACLAVTVQLIGATVIVIGVSGDVHVSAYAYTHTCEKAQKSPCCAHTRKYSCLPLPFNRLVGAKFSAREAFKRLTLDLKTHKEWRELFALSLVFDFLA